MIDLIIKALAPVLPDEMHRRFIGRRFPSPPTRGAPDGDYWVFLEVNEGAYGGRPNSRTDRMPSTT